MKLMESPCQGVLKVRLRMEHGAAARQIAHRTREFDHRLSIEPSESRSTDCTPIRSLRRAGRSMRREG